MIGSQGECLTNHPLRFPAVILSSLPLVVAYVALRRHFIAGITAGAGQGQPFPTRPSGS